MFFFFIKDGPNLKQKSMNGGYGIHGCKRVNPPAGGAPAAADLRVSGASQQLSSAPLGQIKAGLG